MATSVFLAYSRAMRSLSQPKVFWHLLWPSALAIGVWMGLAYFYWGSAIAATIGWIQAWPWVGEWFAPGGTAVAALSIFVQIFLLIILVPLIFASSALLVSLLALPLLLEQVSQKDYPELEQRRGGSFAGSVWNAFAAFVLFALVAILSLPLWLIPGLGLMLSIFLSAWLNKRCYCYDALMNHADRDEMQKIWRERRWGMNLIGFSTAALAYVPVLNLLVPAFTGLAFVHYLLESLRQSRQVRIAI